ncbi:MAG: regulator [Gammaproteobacteria bacterium]|nr:MAG: regulator [Gammaproteobacteria bacterium]
MKTINILFMAVLGALPFSLWAADKSTDTRQYIVMESFEVGANVNVRSLLNDPEENSLWVGTSVGVLQVDLKSRDIVQTFTRAEGLANEYVFSLYRAKNGALWFGTNGGGASRLLNGTWKTFFPMHGLADYWVYAFNEQSDGTIWIGTWNGVNRFDPKTGNMTTYVRELVNEWVYALAVDKEDQVWFGTEGGISMFDGQNWHEWTHKNGLGADNIHHLPQSPNTGLGTRHRHNLAVMMQGQDSYNENYVFSLQIDPQGKIWAGTWGGGVSIYDPKKGGKWQNLTQKDGLAGNIVYSMAQDDDGVFWFGTDHGLSRYDGEHWETYTMKDGLLGNSVYAVAVTSGHQVWAGTRRGVAHLQHRESKETVH